MGGADICATSIFSLLDLMDTAILYDYTVILQIETPSAFRMEKMKSRCSPQPAY